MQASSRFHQDHDMTPGSNAFLGVINIITRHSADAPGAKASVSAGSSAIGDVGLELGDVSETGSLRLNAEFNLKNSFGHREHRAHREKQWFIVNMSITHRVNLITMRNPRHLCVLCDL
ncbi:MAG: hypothetical protein Q8O38_14040, partial [Sulfurimicrobium sp.]|nr:hypothetical protein [Sulfurimicrobium sp.]